MFGTTTKKTLPQEYIDSYLVWDTYMAKIWYSLLEYCEISSADTIIEVAPGASKKIGLALSELHFNGNLYVVEPCLNLLNLICNQYDKLLPNATIFPINANLGDCYNSLPKHADLILSNHPIDDMILSCNSKKNEQNKLFNWAVKGDVNLTDIFKNNWLSLLSEPDLLQLAKNTVENEWKQALTLLQPTSVIISQYASDALNKHNLHELNMHAKEILNKLKRYFNCEKKDTDIQSVLNHHENYNNLHIGTEILNASHWMVSRRG